MKLLCRYLDNFKESSIFQINANRCFDFCHPVPDNSEKENEWKTELSYSNNE